MNKRKIILLASICFACVTVSAKNIYLSAVGNDADTGATQITAVKTLSMAITLAANNDTVRVLDFIDISQEPSKQGSINDINIDGSSSYTLNGKTYKTWNAKGNEGVKLLNRKITIAGASKETAGFDGNNATRLLRMDGITNEVIYKNLTFKSGNSLPSQDSGAGLYIKDSHPVFENCSFIQNKSNQGDNNNMRRGGACYIYSDAKFKDCLFSENLSREGSALYIASGNIELENCRIENHNSTDLKDADGGALYLTKDGAGTVSLSMKQCLLKNNKSKRSGGALYVIDRSDNTQFSIHVEACAFINNEALSDNGGAIYMDNYKEGSLFDATFINSTFYGNQAKTCGGAFNYQRGRAGSKLTFVNCTITRNSIVGSNIGLGPAFRFHCQDNSGEGPVTTRNVIKKIYNTIIENNYVTETPTKGTDLSFRAYTPENEVDFFLYHSFVGKVMAKATYLPAKTNGNYFGYDTDALAGLATPYSNYIDAQNAIPLVVNATARTTGNAAYLKTLNIYTDQLGNNRPFPDNKCAIGAIEPTVEIQGSGEPYIYEHLILSGQSLSTGDQTYPVISPENVPGNYMIGDQVWINYLNHQKNEMNPLIATICNDVLTMDNRRSRESGARSESPMLGMANHIQLKKQDDKRLLVTSCGYSGSSVEELSKESQINVYYNDFQFSLIYGAKLTRERNSTITCPALFWMQGEFNYSTNVNKGLYPGVPNTTNKDVYKSLLMQLKTNMQNDVLAQYGQTKKPVFITYQTGAQYMRDSLDISMAQLEASNEYDDVICAGPHYQVADRGGHLDANGSRWYGEMLGKVYYKTQVLGEDFKPLQPKELSRGTQPNQIIIQFHVPKPPLVLDTNILPKMQNYGFEVYLNKHEGGSKQTITNVTLLGDDKILLTCQNPLTGNVIVTYAGSKVVIETKVDGKNELHGHGNLRDSDDYPAFYTYIDLDKKNGDGSYFYQRDATETTLRPDFEPKDMNGEIIYNKPYPLYNFCVGFYYTIAAGKDKFTVPVFDETTSASIKKKTASEIKISYSKNTLIVEKNEPGEVRIDLYDITGKKVKTIVDYFSSTGKKEYPLETLTPSAYLAKVTVNRETSISKIVII